MGSVVPPITALLKLSVIWFVFTVQGSAGNIISPAPAEAFPIEGTLSPSESKVGSNGPSSGPRPNVSDVRPPPPLLAPPIVPTVSPPLSTAPPPQIRGFAPSSPVIPSVSPPLITAPPPENGGLVPSPPPIVPIVSPPLITAPPPQNRGLVPSPPVIPIASPPLITVPPPPSPVIPVVSPPVSLAPPPVPEPPVEPNVTQRKAPPVAQAPLPVPVVSPSTNFSSPPEASPTIKPTPPEIPPSRGHRSAPPSGTPKPVSDTSAASPPSNSGWNQPPAHPIAPAMKPPVTPVPTVSPVRESPRSSPSLAPPPFKPLEHLPPVSHSPAKGSFSAVSPSPHNSPVPVFPSPKSSPFEGFPSPESSPSVPSHKQSHGKARTSSPAPTLSPPSSDHQGPVVSPPSVPTSKKKHYAPSPSSPGSQYPIPKPVINGSPAPSPSPPTSGWTKMPILPPKATPIGSSAKSPKVPFIPPIHTLPPPPPNEDCSSTVCMDPFTNTPPGSPCSCVLPMQVGLQLNVALYTFFPLVSELAHEIAVGVFMNPSQVRIMGANAASQEPEKTIVLIDLVPLGKRFDNTTAFLTSQRFWLKKVAIKASYFGDYKVLYVRYPGLPPSPPSADSGISIIDDGPYSGNNNNGRTIKPLGVDVEKGHQKNRLGAGAIAVIALSASVLVVLCSAAAWVFLVRNRGCFGQPKPTPPPLPASTTKPSGTTGSMVGSAMSSASLSFGSSIPPYTGSAKTFSSLEIERATNNFDDSRILGEGGFGLVYSGVLEDGTRVAVKVLKRDDHQGGREFLAEVEMLSRLHHRNLVKLIGICTEERNRCLVYELIPNGSVESHLHGVDKESAPLDWDARIKIALGAARGLAYLHEDSSPRVIHRDFKSSNILLEHDFTPKVSDFGLARTALDEENRHISTRVMGTFGYVAPEYAMTGHLLVKSDVYSYGVVLLELLTGRKPVDMSQPPGQENLVAWARPLLTSKEGLQTIIDPSLGPDMPFDSVAKVAAIASMCVQPEVSHRPFMGEVVQALKLICNECDEAREVGSSCSSRESEADVAACGSSVEITDGFQTRTMAPGYDSEVDIERGLSVSDLFGASVRLGGQGEGSFRRYSSSGPLDRGRGADLWQRIRRLRGGSASEHGIFFRLWPSSN